jgi:hypothetical protein
VCDGVECDIDFGTESGARVNPSVSLQQIQHFPVQFVSLPGFVFDVFPIAVQNPEAAPEIPQRPPHFPPIDQTVFQTPRYRFAKKCQCEAHTSCVPASVQKSVASLGWEAV